MAGSELQMFVGRGRARIDAARAAADAAPVEAVAAGSDMQAGGLGPATAEDGEGGGEIGIEGQYGVVGGLDLDALMAENMNCLVVAGAAGGFAGRSFVWSAVSECAVAPRTDLCCCRGFTQFWRLTFSKPERLRRSTGRRSRC